MTPATSAVAAATSRTSGTVPPPTKWPVESGWVPMISGFSTTMYAIVKKVTSPPRSSRPRVERRLRDLEEAGERVLTDGGLGALGR